MRFTGIKYLEWFKTKGSVEYDLCSSGIKKLFWKDLCPNWKNLDISGDHFYGYSPLIEQIAKRYGVKKENVTLANGTSFAIFLVCAALLHTGDEVLIESPVYEPLLAVPKAMDTTIRRFNRPFNSNFLPDLNQIHSLINDKTRLILLSNPHNPTGAEIEASFFLKLNNMIEDRNIHVIIDEIYFEFLNENKYQTIYDLSEKFISISSLTKVFGLGDLRCGWVLSSREITNKIKKIIDYTTANGVFIGEKISSMIFSRLDEIKTHSTKLLLKNFLRVKQFIQNESDLSWVEPAGGTVCFPRIDTELTGDKFAEILLNKYKTAVVPGSFFEAPQHFRIGMGADPDILEAGLENMSHALQTIP